MFRRAGVTTGPWVISCAPRPAHERHRPHLGEEPMERKRASDFPQELLNLFDKYVHGGIDRRTFLDRAQKFAVGGVTATALLEMLKPNYALAIQIQPTDNRIKGE